MECDSRSGSVWKRNGLGGKEGTGTSVTTSLWTHHCTTNLCQWNKYITQFKSAFLIEGYRPKIMIATLWPWMRGQETWRQDPWHEGARFSNSKCLPEKNPAPICKATGPGFVTFRKPSPLAPLTQSNLCQLLRQKHWWLLKRLGRQKTDMQWPHCNFLRLVYTNACKGPYNIRTCASQPQPSGGSVWTDRHKL